MFFPDHIRRLAHAAVWVQRHLRGKLFDADATRAASLLGPSDIVLDVGAHSGSWAVALSKFLPNGHVYAIEALPYYANVLRLTVVLLRRRNVTVLNRAVNATGEHESLVWKNADGERLTGLTHIASPEEVQEGTVVVPGLRLDSLLASVQPLRLRLIKMDIEGAELPALRGAQTILETHQPALYLEAFASHTVRYGYELPQLFAFLEDLGYSAFLARYGARPTPISASEYSGKGDLWFLTERDAELILC